MLAQRLSRAPAGARRNLLYGQVGAFEQLARSEQALAHQPPRRRDATLLDEAPREVALAHVGVPRHLRDADRCTEISTHPLAGALQGRALGFGNRGLDVLR